jgi:hypothetical protein
MHQLKPQRGLIQVLKDSIDTSEVINVSRTGHSLVLGYAMTDFYAQGLSFNQDAFFLHLHTTGQIKAGNLRVPLTRPSTIEGVRLLSDLWTTEKEKESLAKRIVTAFALDVAFVAEMTRLELLNKETLLREGGADLPSAPNLPNLPPSSSAHPSPLSSTKRPRDDSSFPSTNIPQPEEKASRLKHLLATKLGLQFQLPFKYSDGESLFDSLTCLVASSTSPRNSNKLRRVVASWLIDAYSRGEEIANGPDLDPMDPNIVCQGFDSRLPASLLSRIVGVATPFREGGLRTDLDMVSWTGRALGIDIAVHKYKPLEDRVESQMFSLPDTERSSATLQAHLFFSIASSSVEECFEPLNSRGRLSHNGPLLSLGPQLSRKIPSLCAILETLKACHNARA